ncbi:MAG: cyclopropane-fatty-acyl-phospholipid synthase family protein [Gammaproteobacteria bacterium]|nr:cyclopropane-fatty-acyl-phospholipid synthase family protein [Gammaproteobacteria bacterium]
MASIAKHAILKQLQQLREGQLVIDDHGERYYFGAITGIFPAAAVIKVNDASFYSMLAFGGSIGAGESYIMGHWKCENLTNVMRIMVRNMELLDNMEKRLARLSNPFRKILHWLNRNTLAGSRNNIAAHYDLGNDFFELFLDPTMMYSCGIFENGNSTMEQASRAKLKRICDKLDIKPGDRIVEIGTGWGGFAIYAAKHYGCHVTTTTISQNQHQWAQRRILEENLEDRITLLFEDYRNLKGQYDKLVSIEMIEAVGHRYYDTFFKKCGDLLKPDGIMLIQAITIADQRYEQAKRSVDFIQRYIFPGSCIPSNTAILNSTTRASDLRLFHLEDFGPHYATTLRMWKEKLFRNRDIARERGYPDTLIRMWDFYLCYCEGGFAERVISDVHYIFTKPLNRNKPLMPDISSKPCNRL